MKITAAGIVVFRITNNQLQILGLKALKETIDRVGGIYDVPKGQIDPGESPFQAACRECYEESGIKSVKLIDKDPVLFSPLALWVGEVNGDVEITLKENPETGEIEHQDYKWVTIDEMKNNCLTYLKPHIVKTEKILKDYYESN